MEKEITIKSIKILMGNREVELSIEEAKKLKKALEEIFGEKIVNKTEHIHHYDRYGLWPYYAKATFESPKKYDFGTVYCSTTKSDSNMKNLCLSIE